MPMINVSGGLPPEIQQQQQALNRQQQMAQLLMQQGQTMPSGQMVSGRFVAPSFFQYAAPLFQTYAGKSLARESDKEALALAKKIREGQNAALADYISQSEGKPPVEGGIYGADNRLTMQTTPDMFGPNMELNPQYRRVEARPAVPANPRAANLSAAQNDLLPDWMRQFAIKEVTKGPDWKEITQYNDKTGNTEIYRYNANSPDPRSTMQFLGVSKPAISPEAQIRFGDENINIPAQFRGGAVGQPQGQPTSAYGANVQFTPNQAVGTPQGQPSGQPQVTPNVAPTVASTKEYNPYVAPPVPAGLSGKQARDWKADQAKPLTGDDAKQVTGAINYQKSLINVQNLFDKYKGADLLKPNVRAEIQSAVENARLQGKEANRLGALTGPDYGILEKIIADPTAFDAFLKDRTTINKLYNNQRLFTGEMIKTNYRNAQKAVPENLREYVDIKPMELTTNKPKGQPKASGAVARAMLNGKPIVVRDGKWVDERTGKAVE